MKKIIVSISVMCLIVLMSGCSSENKESEYYESQINVDGLYTGFNDLSESLTIEEAVLGSNYIAKQSKPYANQHIWDDFYERSQKKEECHVRIISFYEADMEHPYYIDIYYKDELYTLYDSSAQDQSGETYKYLLILQGTAGMPPIQMSNIFLTDNPDLKFGEYEKAMCSSLSTAFDGIGRVRLIMFKVVSDTTLINLSYAESGVATSDFDKELDSMTLEIETNYIVLDEINTEEVKTVHCDYEFDYGTSPIVVDHPEGYLVGGFISGDSTSTNSKRLPVIVLIDETGAILWEATYDNPFTAENMSNLVVYDDGRFIFTLSNWPDSSMGSPRSVPSRLIQCNSKGEVNWIKEFDDAIGSALKFVFLTRYEDIIIAGETQPVIASSSAQNNDTSDIGFIKLDSEGNEIARRQYGGLSNEYLKNCQYVPEIGVVFTGWSNSTDGEFASKNTDNPWQDYVAFVNLNLDIEWVNQVETYERMTYDQLVVNGEGIYLMGNSQINMEDDALESKQLFITKYDITGAEVYKTYCLEHHGYRGAMSVDSYGEVVVGSGNFGEGVLSFYDKYGEISHESMDVSYDPRELSPTEDGGFVVKTIREIASIPQPRFVSSMWFDSDVVIEKYDKDKRLVWRKVFNDYDDLRIDSVEVFEN